MIATTKIGHNEPPTVINGVQVDLEKLLSNREVIPKKPKIKILTAKSSAGSDEAKVKSYSEHEGSPHEELSQRFSSERTLLKGISPRIITKGNSPAASQVTSPKGGPTAQSSVDNVDTLSSVSTPGLIPSVSVSGLIPRSLSTQTTNQSPRIILTGEHGKSEKSISSTSSPDLSSGSIPSSHVKMSNTLSSSKKTNSISPKGLGVGIKIESPRVLLPKALTPKALTPRVLGSRILSHQASNRSTPLPSLSPRIIENDPYQITSREREYSPKQIEQPSPKGLDRQNSPYLRYPNEYQNNPAYTKPMSADIQYTLPDKDGFRWAIINGAYYRPDYTLVSEEVRKVKRDFFIKKYSDLAQKDKEIKQDYNPAIDPLECVHSGFLCAEHNLNVKMKYYNFRLMMAMGFLAIEIILRKVNLPSKSFFEIQFGMMYSFEEILMGYADSVVPYDTAQSTGGTSWQSFVWVLSINVGVFIVSSLIDKYAVKAGNLEKVCTEFSKRLQNPNMIELPQSARDLWYMWTDLGSGGIAQPSAKPPFEE